MANREACELYIEQEIESGLEEGKTPYTIGKELSDWMAKLFEVRISPETLKSRAYRQQKENGSNEPKKSNISSKTAAYGPQKSSAAHPPTDRGGRREGAGRPKTDKEGIISDDFKIAWETLLEEIKRAKRMNWKETSKEAALLHVRILHDIIIYR